MDATSTISPFLQAQIERAADGKAVAPDNIIQSLAGAQMQYELLRQAHIDRIKLYAAIEGMVAGNPPYDQEELDNNGLGHITNINNFKGRSYYERCGQMYWNLLNSTEIFIKVLLTGNYPNVQQYAHTIARHTNDVIREWEDFYTNIGMLGAQLAKFGLCPIIWANEKSWMWEVVDVSKFFIPSQTQSNISKLSTICIETEFTLQELYQIYNKLSDDDTGDSDDWNKDALGDFLIYRSISYSKDANGTVGSVYDALTWQRFIQNNDGNVIKYFNETVRLVHLFQKEYDGKFSHYIFSKDKFTPPQGSGYASFNADFLFFVPRQYECIDDFLLIFTASPGEWTIHSNLGVGQKVFSGVQAINMLDCSIVDMSIMSATPLLRTLAAGGRDANPIRFIPGVATDIGAAEIVQNQLGANINQLVGASQYLNQGLDVNAANAGDDPAQPDRSQGSISSTQARMRSFNEFGTLKNDVAHFYHKFDITIRNMFVRMLEATEGDPGYEYIEEIKLRCEIDGVPKELWAKDKKSKVTKLPIQFRSVKASRVAGDGSTLARIMGLETLGQISGTFNPKEMASFKRDFVEATMGVDYVATYASSEGSNDESSGGASLAGLENNALQEGKQATFSMDNEHGTHALIHMQLLMSINKALQEQQMSPVDAVKIYEVALPHTQEHIQAMQQAPQFYREVLAQVEEPFGQILKLAQLAKKNAQAMIQAAVRKQEQDAAKTQEVMTDEQRKDFVAIREQNRKDAESAHKMERNAQQSDERGEIMKEKVESDAEIKRLKVIKEAQVKREATAIGRTQNDLMEESPDELRGRLTSLSGTTPSNIDYE